MDILPRIENKQISGFLTINKRIIFEGAIYHVTQRAPGREYIFLEENDYACFLGILKKTARKFNLHILSYAFLSNHLHLLFQITEKNLSSAMKNLFEKYANYFNKKYCRKGHVFCGRFRASLCYEEDYLLAASIYIHLNPCRARIVEGFRDYKWTSIRYFVGEDPDAFVSSKRILTIIDADLQTARSQYVKILNHSMKMKNSILWDPKSIKRSIRNDLGAIWEMLGKGRGIEFKQLMASFQGRKRVRQIEHQKARQYLIQQLLADGFSRQEIMEKFSISKTTLYKITNPNKSDLKGFVKIGAKIVNFQ